MCNIRKAARKEYPLLEHIWEDAVCATHGFLSPEDFRYYRSRVTDYLSGVDIYVYDDGAIKGFMGLCGDKLEMLFVGVRREGVGTRLLHEAVYRYGVRRLDVNEQNIPAMDFYLRHGFVQSGRSETDGEGRPYPIVEMEFKQDNQ